MFRYFIGAPWPISIFCLVFSIATNATFTTHTHTHTGAHREWYISHRQTWPLASIAFLLLLPSPVSAPLRRCFSRFWRLRCTNCRLFAQPWQENSQLPAACCASATQFKKQQQLQQQNWEKLQTNGKTRTTNRRREREREKNENVLQA